MAEPLEVKLTGRRRVLCDVDGENWRVAFYAPTGLRHPQVRALEKRADRGSREARDELDALEIGRSIGKAPTLSDALTAAMTRPDPAKPHLMLPADLREVVEISEYVLKILERLAALELGQYLPSLEDVARGRA